MTTRQLDTIISSRRPITLIRSHGSERLRDVRIISRDEFGRTFTLSDGSVHRSREFWVYG